MISSILHEEKNQKKEDEREKSVPSLEEQKGGKDEYDNGSATLLDRSCSSGDKNEDHGRTREEALLSKK